MKRQTTSPKLLFVLALVALFAINCATTRTGGLLKEANILRDQGGVAATGIGESKSESLARQKAHQAALGNLSTEFGVKINRLTKSFQQEVGGDVNDAEINALFTNVQKAVVSEEFSNAKIINEKISKNGGTYRYEILVGITPDSLNDSIINKMQTVSKQHLYERFRASEAFKELQKEMDDYDKDK